METDHNRNSRRFMLSGLPKIITSQRFAFSVDQRLSPWDSHWKLVILAALPLGFGITSPNPASYWNKSGWCGTQDLQGPGRACFELRFFFGDWWSIIWIIYGKWCFFLRFITSYFLYECGVVRWLFLTYNLYLKGHSQIGGSTCTSTAMWILVPVKLIIVCNCTLLRNVEELLHQLIGGLSHVF